MRVLAKSLLDLVPLAIVTIIISVLASQSLDELSVNYNEIIICQVCIAHIDFILSHKLFLNNTYFKSFNLQLV